MANGVPELASDWPREDRSELYEARERLLVDAKVARGIIPVDDLNGDTVKLLATLSLFQEGFLELDPGVPGLMSLTESGRKLALGYSALHNA